MGPRWLVVGGALGPLGVLACGLDAVGSATIEVASSPVDGSVPEGSTPSPDDGSSGSDSGPVIDAASDSSPDSGTGCPAARGATMIRVTVAAPSFCIDATEATEAHYAAFRASSPATSTLPASCSFKSSFLVGSTDGVTLPVNFIDWCDAYAFCAWAGKRLCKPSEWKTACTGGTTRTYPYGSTFDPAKCNDTEGTIAASGSFTGCVGPVAGIFDMSGNADEWIDECNTSGTNGSCSSMGGDFNDDPTTVTCATVTTNARESTSRVRGVRCCAP